MNGKEITMRAIAVLVASIMFAAVMLVSNAQAATEPARDAGILSTSMFLTPSSQTINTGNTAAFNLQWSGYDTFNESFALYYEGGGSIFDTYTCFSACSSGNTGFQHVYTSSGTRFPIAADDRGGLSNSVTVNVN